MNPKIAYQGVEGAYSEQACKSAYPNYTPISCETFQEAMWLVEQGDADLAMIPLENSTAGRVEEIYRLIPKMALHVIAEHYEPVVHCLLGTKDAKIEDLVCVGSHPQALAQCHNNILNLGLEAIAKLDTAGAAKELATYHDKTKGAIASKLAAEIYGLQVLREHFEDVQGNVTRFFILSNENIIPLYHDNQDYVTSLLFQVRDIPAALYKALGGFATNSVNLLKLESYPMEGTLQASQFHIDLDGHPQEKKLKLALEELAFFADDVRMLGTYKAHKFRESFIH
jgi:prephenate dehydratase